MSTKVIFRTDAFFEIGTGHVMRCLALANACRKVNIETRFVGRIEDNFLLALISQYGHQFTALEPGFEKMWLNLINREIDWVVLDGYQFRVKDHRIIRGIGVKLLVIDDLANLESYEADVILNQNFHASTKAYKSVSNTTMLMGSKFALLRQEFLEIRPWDRSVEARRVLITLGGSDPQGVTLKVIEALVNMHSKKRFDVRLIAGSSNLYLDQLKSASEFARISGHTVELIHFTEDMAKEMAWADIAVIAGGTTSLEVAYMGLPSLVLVLADNQVPIADAMQSMGIAESLGWHNRVSPDTIAVALDRLARDVFLRRSMTACGQDLVDGLGAKRVVEIMMEKTFRT